MCEQKITAISNFVLNCSAKNITNIFFSFCKYAIQDIFIISVFIIYGELTPVVYMLCCKWNVSLKICFTYFFSPFKFYLGSMFCHLLSYKMISHSHFFFTKACNWNCPYAFVWVFRYGYITTLNLQKERGKIVISMLISKFSFSFKHMMNTKRSFWIDTSIVIQFLKSTIYSNVSINWNWSRDIVFHLFLYIQYLWG